MTERINHPEVLQPSSEVNFAGFVVRLIAYIIDAAFNILISLIFGMSVGLALGLINPEMFEAAYLASGITTLICTIAFWATTGGTPGKLMLGMRIAGPDVVSG